MTRVNLDGEDPAAGLAALVLTLIDLLLEVLEREAVRRMEGDRLSDEEVERLGAALAEIEAEIDRLIAEFGVEDEVRSLRGDLDGLVESALGDVPTETAEERPASGRRAPTPPSPDPTAAPSEPGDAPPDPDEPRSERGETSPEEDDRGTEPGDSSDHRRIDRGGESSE